MLQLIVRNLNIHFEYFSKCFTNTQGVGPFLYGITEMLTNLHITVLTSLFKSCLKNMRGTLTV